MNAATLLLAVLLPATSALTPAFTVPAPAPITPGYGPAAGACVAPAGMTGLIDQDPSDEQLPWRRTSAGRVSVYFAAAGISPQWRADMQYGSVQWNKSPCLDTHVVDACPAATNCVTVSVVGKGEDGNFDAVERDGFTVGGHIAYFDTLTTNQKRNVAVHEMGHAVGLKHRKTKHVLMNGDTYDDVFTPDPTEYQNLLFDYGRQRPTGADTGSPYGGAAAASFPGSNSPSATGGPAGGSESGSAGPVSCPVPAGWSASQPEGTP